MTAVQVLGGERLQTLCNLYFRVTKELLKPSQSAIETDLVLWYLDMGQYRVVSHSVFVRFL